MYENLLASYVKHSIKLETSAVTFTGRCLKLSHISQNT